MEQKQKQLIKGSGPKKKKGNWDNKLSYRIRLSLQKKGDADILFHLGQQENQSGYIRNALRYYIEHEDEILAAENNENKTTA